MFVLDLRTIHDLCNVLFLVSRVEDIIRAEYAVFKPALPLCQFVVAQGTMFSFTIVLLFVCEMCPNILNGYVQPHTHSNKHVVLILMPASQSIRDKSVCYANKII